jgi:hypothetical protein
VEEDHAQDTTETKAVLRAVIAAAGHATALPAWADYQDLTGAEIPLADSDQAFKVWKQRELESAGIPTLLDGLGWSQLPHTFPQIADDCRLRIRPADGNPPERPARHFPQPQGLVRPEPRLCVRLVRAGPLDTGSGGGA